MNFETKTVPPSTGSDGPHFKSNPQTREDTIDVPHTETFEHKLDVCKFEKDEDLFPEASMEQKSAMLTAVVLPLIGVGVAAYITSQYGLANWYYLAMAIGGWVLTSLGITVGFHRLMSHKSFETYRWVRATWMCLGSMSVEGAPLIWCAVHRRHHSCSDHDGDPHSPHLHEGGFVNAWKGFWYAQVGWLFAGYWSKPDLKKYVPDLLKDKMLVWLSDKYYVFVVISFLIPMGIGFAIDGWLGLGLGFLWGGLVRMFITHHITWSINSICHIFGKREYKSNDHSTNNAICGVLAMGEGWHNNHHAFPSSARHGLKWWQFDMSWIIIKSMQLVGLAWNIKLPTRRQLELKRIGN